MVRALKPAEWPQPDRLAWTEACRPGHRLVRGGRASHLKPVTQDDLAQRFGLFGDFVNRRFGLDLLESITMQLTPEIIAAYVEELQGRVSSVTVHGSIYKLRRAAEIINADLDLGWLLEIEYDLEPAMRPRPKAPRIVFSGLIAEAGLTLMQEAETATQRSPLQRAQLARNGLMLALLAVCPIRLKNFSSLTIGQNFVREGKRWWILLSETEPKSQRRDHRAVPEELTPWIGLYLDRYRPLFPPAGDALWPSQRGGALTANSAARLITLTTEQTLGKPINPHLFRHCVPYTIASIDSSRIDLASPLLDHIGARTREKHYTHGQNTESAKTFFAIVSEFRDGPDCGNQHVDDGQATTAPPAKERPA